MVIKSQQVPGPTVILRRKEVQARTGLSRSTIYLRVSQGSFPKSVPLGPRAVGWLESEVIWVSEGICPNCRSRGVVTEEAMVSALAPGSRVETWMVG